MSVSSNEVPFEILAEQESPARIGLEVEVYRYDNPNQKIDNLPRRWNPTTLDEIGGPGGGSVSIWANDEIVAETPEVLEWRNLVRVRLDHKCVGAFLLLNKETEMVSRDEVAGEVIHLSGEGPRAWFRDAVVMPYRGLKEKSPGSRVFSFASERGAWYKTADWVTPVNIQQHNLDPNPGPWGTAPAEWPDAPSAWWIWGVDNDATNPAPAGYNFFRYEFTIAEEVGTKNYAVFAAADNRFQAFVDGQEVLVAEEADSWTRTWRADFELSPGDHVLAFRVYNASVSPAALIAALFRHGDAAAETAAELLTVTGDAGWLVNPYPDPSPGWTPGEIILTLLAEAEARGVVFPTFLTPTFTTELDSKGLPWPRALDWSFAVGTEYYEVVERLEEAVCDLWIDPETLELNMYVERGANRSEQTDVLTPVMFQVGHNVTRAHAEGTSEIKNTLVLETSDGWRLQTPAAADSVNKYGRIEGSLATSLSPAVSADVANAVFGQRAVPVLSSTYDIVDMDDARPFVDFWPGDWVLAPQEDGELAQVRVMSISATEDTKSGQPKFALEFGSKTEDQLDRHERWLKTISNAALSGTVSNVGGTTGSSGNPTTQSTQTGPAGLQGEPGPPGILWRGAWSAGTSYAYRDAVSYDGQSWLALQESTGVTPVAGADWTLLAARGAPGDPGESGVPGVVYQGAWSSLTVYVTGDLVNHSGQTWIANAGSTGEEPGVASSWDPFLVVSGLPPVGSEGQVLTTVSGEWAPADPSGGAGTVQTTTLTAVDGDGTLALARAATVLSVQYSAAGRFRLYRNAAGRAADAARAFGTAYPGGAGLLYDYLASGAETDLERPFDVAYAPGESTLYYAADGPIDVTLTWVTTAGG